MRTLKWMGLALAAVVVFPAASAAQTPLGAEFAVRSGTGWQGEPSLALNPQGGFVVTWTETLPPQRVAGRRYDPAGNPVGADFVVTAQPSTYPFESVVGADGSGNFVVVWSMEDQDGSGEGVFGRRFDAAGAPIGGEFQVNTTTAGHQYMPSLAVATSGRFVVGWQTPGILLDKEVFAQSFDAAGNRVGPELVVNSPVNVRYHTAVSMNPAGEFILVWADKAQRAIHARRYDAAAQQVGAEFRVSTNSAGSHIGYPSVAQGASGEFVVAWQRWLVPPPIPPGFPEFEVVHVQRFDASGVKVGAEYEVPGFDHARFPAVALHAGGQATVAWASTAGTLGIFRRNLDPSGRPIGPVERVTAMNAGPPAMATEDSSRLVIAWQTPWIGPDADVWARLFDRLSGTGMTVDPAPVGGSDGNGVLDPGETVTVAPAWANLHGGTVAAFGGSALNFNGPGNAVYTIIDGTAGYEAIPGGGTGNCEGATPDCYQLSIPAPGVRPIPHWDAGFDEALTPSSEHGGRRWDVHVGESFADVLRGSPFYRFVETLLHRGVTTGCSGSSYCPVTATTREQMAVFALKGREGAQFVPQACGAPTAFDDVPAANPFCRWIEELARRGVVAGCGPRLYCPTAAVSRETMAVFVLRTLDPALLPPPCAPPNVFADVPETSPFCRWVEELAARGVVSGCAPGLYCPTAPVTREQMAVFIGVTFGLTLYGP